MKDKETLEKEAMEKAKAIFLRSQGMAPDVVRQMTKQRLYKDAYNKHKKTHKDVGIIDIDDQMNITNQTPAQIKAGIVGAGREMLNIYIREIEEKYGITYGYKAQRLQAIIDSETSKDSDRISAIAELNKMQGHYAPTQNINHNLNANIDLKDIANVLERVRREY